MSAREVASATATSSTAVPRRTAVVGGGLLGGRLASRLATEGCDVTLFEAAPTLGGLASAWQLGPVTWDRHYHVTLLSDSHTRELLRDLDLESSMRWVETQTGFFTRGRMHSLNSSLDYLKFPALGPVAKARLAATILWASRQEDGEPLHAVPVETWLRKWSGDSTFERLWRPLLRAKLGEQYLETSATFIWATIRRLYAARRSGLKRELFGYVPGGYARVLDALAARLGQQGVAVKTGRRVTRVEAREDGRLEVESDAEDEAEPSVEEFEQVVVTAPAPIAAQLCRGLRDDERTHLADTTYQGIVCASLLLPKPLAPYYLTYLTDADLPFTAVVEMSSFVDPDEFGGRTLVYLPKYTSADDPLFEAPDGEIQRQFIEGLRRVHPSVQESDVEAFRVSRVRHVFPIPRYDRPRTPPPFQTSVPGLQCVSSAQIVDGTLNVNDTLGLADQAWPAVAGLRSDVS